MTKQNIAIAIERFVLAQQDFLSTPTNCEGDSEELDLVDELIGNAIEKSEKQ